MNRWQRGKRQRRKRTAVGPGSAIWPLPVPVRHWALLEPSWSSVVCPAKSARPLVKLVPLERLRVSPKLLVRWKLLKLLAR